MGEKFRFKISRYTVLTHLYFFFNSLMLPMGLLYTHLLSPYFYFKLYLKKRRPLMPGFLLVLLLFDLIHLYNGVHFKSLCISNVLFISSYIFILACSDFILNHVDLEKRFKELLISNFVFMFIALVIFFTPWRETLWYVEKITNSTGKFPRLALLTYEASYYSMLLIPIIFYYLTKLFLGQNHMSGIAILIMTMLPLVLSLSFGVIGATIATLIVIYLMHWKKIFYKKYVFISLVVVVSCLFIAVLSLYIFYPDNIIFFRLKNIFAGIDSSAKGRISDSYSLAKMVVNERSIWFGAGLGQIKILAPEIVGKYFNYWGDLETFRIPNTVAETFATFGIIGLVFRFGIILYLFFKTKVWGNYYRMALFVFVFIYQFTGSFLVNVVEFTIWILAFSPVFPQFNVKNIKPQEDEQ